MRVVLAEDSGLLRDALVRLLDDAGFVVLAAVGTAVDLLDVVETDLPDLVITDIRMPPDYNDEGLQAAVEIRESHPEVGVVVLSQYVESGAAADLLSAGGPGSGYLLKDRLTDAAEFIAAVREVCSGGSVVDPEVVRQLMSRRRVVDPLAALTHREREILQLMADGHSNAAIASDLFVSAKTVETHIAKVFQKLGLTPEPETHRRVLAVIQFLRHR